MPILIMGVSAFIVFVLVMAIMIAAALEERQNTAEENKTQEDQAKAVKAA